MAYLFRINKKATGVNNIFVDWNSSANSTYNQGFINNISDTSTTQREITSIPSPFARIELAKEAFAKVVGGSINGLSVEEVKKRLHGNSIYHKMVSDALDVGQIFFNYPSMKDKVEIIVWDPSNIANLKNSVNHAHKIYGKSLEMFFKQDAMGRDPYNFGKLKKMYILRYIGPHHRPMHIIGATSPATLFFSTANDDTAISKYLCFDQDYAFDGHYASLDMRDREYLKYIFTLKYSIPNFSTDFPEVNDYLNAVYSIISEELKGELKDIETNCLQDNQGNTSYIDQTFEPLNVNATQTEVHTVEVNGHYLHNKIVRLNGNTDFEIQATKELNTPLVPLVLPVVNTSYYEQLRYYGNNFGRNTQVPYFDPRPLASRTLPGINIAHPYLTISDFLEDKIIKFPRTLNNSAYHNGNYNSSLGEQASYLYPLTKTFFDYFTVENLKGRSVSGKNFIEIIELASGVKVILRIPIVGGEIEYSRIYTLDVPADKNNNNGAIVLAPDDFNVGIFPPIKYNSPRDAHYRIAIMADFNITSGCSCICHNEEKNFFVPNYVLRNVDIEQELQSKVYLLDNCDFDCLQISIVTDQPGRENRASGFIIPKFPQRMQAGSLAFAIDLGTSNTHIEYTTGDQELPKPFNYSEDKPMFSMVCEPSNTIRDHARGEFLPEMIGENAICHFPTRTVLGIDRNNSGINGNGVGSYVAFGNASPAFMYNKKDVGNKYNEFIPNLKWSQINQENEERIRCYIESLFLMIRTKVLQEGASLSSTQIKWFYPISMSNNKKSLFQKVWREAYQTYFNPLGEPIAITESIAPYSFFQKTMSDVTNIVTVDIGGGTTDVVVADTSGVKLISSFRFAADAIFGNTLVSVQNGSLNGIIKQFKNTFLENLNSIPELRRMLEHKTQNNYGNSTEVASFLFSLEEHELAYHLRRNLSFNSMLCSDTSQKIVFYIFFSSIMYHIANLMKAKNLKSPQNIAFSGNGSKVISVLSLDKKPLEKLTTEIFGSIYGPDITDIKLIINSQNPKEATCKGGLFLSQTPDDVSVFKSVLLGSSKSLLVDVQKYSEVSKYYDNVVNEIRNFINLIFISIPLRIKLNKEFGIDNESISIAETCFNKDLKTYLEKGVELKLQSRDVNADDVIEESLFFYPIIGIINDLSEEIFNSQCN